MFDKMEKSFAQDQDLSLNGNKIDINKVNSKEVRNNIRKLLKNKFGMYNNFTFYLLYLFLL